MDPEKALALLERAGALGILGLMFFLLCKGVLVIGVYYTKVIAERDDYRRRYLKKVDPTYDEHQP